MNRTRPLSSRPKPSRSCATNHTTASLPGSPSNTAHQPGRADRSVGATSIRYPLQFFLFCAVSATITKASEVLFQIRPSRVPRSSPRIRRRECRKGRRQPRCAGVLDTAPAVPGSRHRAHRRRAVPPPVSASGGRVPSVSVWRLQVTSFSDETKCWHYDAVSEIHPDLSEPLDERPGGRCLPRTKPP